MFLFPLGNYQYFIFCERTAILRRRILVRRDCAVSEKNLVIVIAGVRWGPVGLKSGCI